MNEVPPLLPLPELTECQALVGVWLEQWQTTLIVIGILAFIGGIGVVLKVMEITGYLIDWTLDKHVARHK